MRTVVLLSGGLDSSTLLAAVLKGEKRPVAVSFDYGSLHRRHELRAAQAVAIHYHIPHMVLTESTGVFAARGALMGGSAMPSASYEELRKAEGPSPTVVPFRNGVLLSLAAAVAAGEGYSWIVYAAHADDAHNWAYPDCTPEFVKAMGEAIKIGTYGKVQLSAPFNTMTKVEIVKKGAELGVPFHLTWSCYNPKEDLHCGRCPACISRREAFKGAGVEDPTEYA